MFNALKHELKSSYVQYRILFISTLIQIISNGENLDRNSFNSKYVDDVSMEVE